MAYVPSPYVKYWNDETTLDTSNPMYTPLWLEDHHLLDDMLVKRWYDRYGSTHEKRLTFALYRGEKEPRTLECLALDAIRTSLTPKQMYLEDVHKHLPIPKSLQDKICLDSHAQAKGRIIAQRAIDFPIIVIKDVEDIMRDWVNLMSKFY
jgi:hypothetical protein